MLTFAVAVATILYAGTLWGWRELAATPFLTFIPPSLPLSLIFMMVLFMMIISVLASALGSLYLADDIEIVLAAPVSLFELFIGRTLYVMLTVIWMPFVFTMPVLLGLGQAHHSSWLIILHAAIALLPFFSIPVMLAVIVASLITALIDPRWSKRILAAGTVVVIFGIVWAAEILGKTLEMRSDPNQIISFINSLERASGFWNPSAWISSLMSEVLLPTGKSVTLRYAALYSAATLCTSLAYIAILLLHSWGYTRVRNSASGSRRPRFAGPLWERLPSHPALTLMLKEFRTIARDLSQTTQVIFLTGICLVYLVHLGAFISIEAFPAESRTLWQLRLLVMHISVTAFFTASICTRLVFASISLEGKNFWLLQTAPLHMRSLFRAKLIAWYPPVALITAALFGVGVAVIFNRWDAVIVFSVMSLFVSFGLVGLGIGLGGYFADFSWEHPSQLALSLGNFTYMVSSVLLIVLNTIPLRCMSVLLVRLEHANDPVNWGLFAGTALLIAGVNVGLGLWALSKGERMLKEGENL